MDAKRAIERGPQSGMAVGSVAGRSTRGGICALLATFLLVASPAAKGAPSNVSPNEPFAGSLKQQCLKAGLTMPRILSTRMRRPGNDSGLPQRVIVRVSYVAMPDACEDRFRRTGQFLIQIKDKSRKRWRNLTVTGKRTWEGVQIWADGSPSSIDVGPSGHGPSAHGDSWYYNKTCRPVRAIVRNRVTSATPKKVWIKRKGQRGFWGTHYPLLGQKSKKFRVELGGHCAKG